MKENESWLARGKAEAEKGIPSGERGVGIVIVVFSVLMVLYYAAHQIQSTGFFTEKFGTLEMVMVYGFWGFWIGSAGLEGVLGRRLLSRLFDVFGGLIFATICIAWLLVVFPFEFAHFADVLPDSLRFLMRWISNDIARVLMVLGIIVHLGAAVYCPIAYKFVGKEHTKCEEDSDILSKQNQITTNNRKGGILMKAIVCTKYGPPEVLQLREVEKPIPKKNEICIKIRATTVTSSDCILRGFNIPAWKPVGLMMGIVMGFGKPRKSILGMAAAGEVDSVGSDVKLFKTGDQVFAYPVMSATKIRFGTYAQYMTIPEDWLVLPKPSNITYEEAAAIPYGAELTMFFLKKGDIQNRKNVLIVGASGTIGTTAVQIAKYYGAKVTGVCSTANLELVRSLGADEVIDYTKEDYSKRSERYDLILDAVPLQVADRKSLKAQASTALAPDGVYVSIDDGLAKVSREDLVLLRDLAESGKFKPVIDRSYPLEEIVEAHRYVESGHKKGNVVITVDHDDKT